jgi:hypothetical protein
VPDEMPDGSGNMQPVAPPYITYQLIEPDSLSEASFYARVWYYDTSFEAISAKVDAIRHAIGNGVSIPIDGGVVWIWRDTNFCQYQPPDEPALKIAYLSMILGAYNY